jgi:hypothetical protein
MAGLLLNGQAGVWHTAGQLRAITWRQTQD